MAVLTIARMGHPILRRRAEPVGDASAAEVRRLVADMMETIRDAPGIGLAAPQVHVPWRIVVFCVPPSRADDPRAPEGSAEGPVPPTVLINPEIEILGGERTAAWEACLSVPGLAGVVPRYARIRYRAVDANGAALERAACGMHARVVQHECDHLDGILYPQRMSDLTTLGFVDEMGRAPAADPGSAL